MKVYPKKRFTTGAILLIVAMFSICVCNQGVIIGNRNVTPDHSGNGIDKIMNDSLRLFASRFQEVDDTFNLTYVPDNNLIDFWLVKKYLKSKNYMDGINNKYFYGFILFAEDFFILISSLHQSQGLASMDNWFILAHTFDYNGKPIDFKTLACNCNNRDLGKNEFFSDSFDIIILTKESIITYIRKTHGTILDEESEEPFENIVYDTVSYHLNISGQID